MQFVTPSTECPGSGKPAAPCRKLYRKPTLIRYGEVRLLTQAGSNNQLETSVGSSTNCNSNDTPHKACVSDRRAKANMVRVGDHPLGFGLYLFEYRPALQAALGQGRHFGVMAQEVERIVPRAVEIHACGFKAVNYEMLGIRTGGPAPQAGS